MMVAVSRDPDAAQWEAAEEKLKEWGRCYRRTSEVEGMPTISFMVEIMAHVRRQQRDQKKERRKRIRQLVREKWKNEEPVDAIEAAEYYGHLEPDPTAQGKQDKSGPKPAIAVDYQSVQIEYIVRRQPKWAQTVLTRSYLYQQRDEDAANELKMRQGEYAQRRRAAVQKVADWLEINYIRKSDTRRGV